MNVDEVAESQHGLITRTQAVDQLSQSAIDRRLRAKRWIPVFPGVYRVSGAPQTPHQIALATTLWAGEGAAVSHLAAAGLLRLGMPDPMWVDVMVNRRTALSSPNVVVHRCAIGRAERVTVDGIACTATTRTLIDCAPLVDGETLEAAFEQARRMGLTSIRAVEQRLARGRTGSALMRDVLQRVQARPTESKLEVKLARLLRTSALPAPTAQYEIGCYRVDYAWPSPRVVCECDGFAWHGSRLQWKRDRRRIAAIEAAGWNIVHVTWDDVTRRPGETLDRIALALRRAA